MFAVRKTASCALRTILSFLVISVFALWVTEAQASAGGGAGGSSGGSGNSGGGQGGGSGGNSGEGDRGGISSDRGTDTVTRDDTGQGTVARGYVTSDDICTGGKWEKC